MTSTSAAAPHALGRPIAPSLPLARLPADAINVSKRWDATAIATDCLTLPNVPQPPLAFVRVPGLDCPVALPSFGRDAARTFADYAKALLDNGIFATGAADAAADEKRVQSLLQTATSVGAASPRVPGRPLVGIVVSSPTMFLDQDRSHPESQAYVQDVIDRVRRDGGEPVIIPPVADAHAPNPGNITRIGVCRALAKPLRGLVGMGGDDLDGSMHGGSNALSIATNLKRDEFEACFARIALSRPLFALAICRSHQLWNSIFGGTMFTDVLKQGATSVSQSQLKIGTPINEPYILKDGSGAVRFANWVELAKGSQLSQIMQPFATGAQIAMHESPGGILLLSILTNSNHHQAVATTGEGFELVGWVPDAAQGVSIIESTQRWNALTAQWHPEVMTGSPHEVAIMQAVMSRAIIFDHLMVELAQVGGSGRMTAAHVDRDARFTQADRTWFYDQVVPRLAHIKRMAMADALEG